MIDNSENFMNTMSLPPILVINLDRSKDRRQHMEKELGRFGVEYSFFPAVDGNKLTRKERSSYSLRHAVCTRDRPLSNAQIGCALSHGRVYEKMIAENIKELLILEDDCIFEDHFFEMLSCRESWLPSEWGLINFASFVLDSDTDYIPLHNLSTSIPPLQLVALKRPHFRTGCYLINLHEAQQLLDILYPIRTTADGLTSIASIGRLNVYTIFPALAKLKAAGFLSTIKTKKHLKSLSRWKNLWVGRWVKLRYGLEVKSYIEEYHSPGTLKRISRWELIKKKMKGENISDPAREVLIFGRRLNT